MWPWKLGSPVPANWSGWIPWSAAGLGILTGMSRLRGTPDDPNPWARRLSHLGNIRGCPLELRKRVDDKPASRLTSTDGGGCRPSNNVETASCVPLQSAGKLRDYAPV